MGEAFGGVDVSRVIYLLLYLFLVIGGLGAMPCPGGIFNERGPTSSPSFPHSSKGRLPRKW